MEFEKIINLVEKVLKGIVIVFDVYLLIDEFNCRKKEWSVIIFFKDVFDINYWGKLYVFIDLVKLIGLVSELVMFINVVCLCVILVFLIVEL